MNEKEIAEIRRRYRPGKNNISSIRGCYVNEKGEIVAQFNQSLPLMAEDEAEKFLGLIKKTLSGTLGKNLLDMEFSTQQVVEGEEHSLLMAVREGNEDAVQEFFNRVIDSVHSEDSYVILLARDKYDIPFRSANGEGYEDASTDVYSYFLCSICPVKLSKPALGYYIYENEFHSLAADWLVAPPQLGFLFPAFDDRNANLYGSLFYTKDCAEDHQAFVDRIFQCQPPMPAAQQQETFHTLLQETLEQDCRFDIIQGVHESLLEMMEEHKANKEEAPLLISKRTVGAMLQSQGVPQEKVALFEARYDENFGEDCALPPKNIVDSKKLKVTSPGVVIQVSSEMSSLIETRIIDGAKYIVIRADSGVELNGVPIVISDKEPFS